MNMNEKVWDIILNYPKYSLRTLASYAGISIGTLSGWRKKKHLPHRDSSMEFLKNLSSNLPKQDKEELFDTIMKECGVVKDNDDYYMIQKEAVSDFYSFLNRALKNDLLNDTFCYGESATDLLWKILKLKFTEWFAGENYISFETRKIGGRVAFLISINEPGRVIPPIIFSYSDQCNDLKEEGNSMEQFKNEYTEEYLLHISATLAELSNDDYRNFLKKYNVYMKEIQTEDFQICVNSNAYIYLRENISHGRERNLNMRAEIIFKKFMESSYLIYKEILCSKYDMAYVNSNFFQSNIGIGNYPYAMRRAISFEKKQIENKLKEMQKLRNGKLALIMDLNCIGGLYGLRLHRYAKQVLCVDASVKTIDAIERTIKMYNKDAQDREIVNVETEWFRDDTSDILTNQNLTEKADCIIIGLGTMSYTKSPELLLRKIGTWLKKDGMIFLSCYNQDSLSVQLKKYENLNYEYDTYHKRFIYGRNKINIPVPVKMFSFSEFKNIIIKYFDFDGQTMWSYPVISSVFPVSEYQQGIDIIKEVDKASVAYSQYRLANGNYNMIIAGQYQSQYKSDLYIRTKSAMMDARIEYKVVKHHAFVSTKNLMEELREKGILVFRNFVKTVIIKDFSDSKKVQYYMVLLLLENRFSWDFLKQHYEKKAYEYKKTKIKFCSEKELRNMGFIVGCICPFSYSVLKNEYKIELLYDPTINHLTCDLVYTYSGGNNMTFELRREELNDYLKASGASSYRME